MRMFEEIIKETEKRHENMKPRNIPENSKEAIYVDPPSNFAASDSADHEDLDVLTDTVKLLHKHRNDAVRPKASIDETKTKGGDAKMKGEANDALIEKMNDGRKDLSKITSKPNGIPPEEIDNIIKEVTPRNEQKENRLHSCMKDNDLVDDRLSKSSENIEKIIKSGLNYFKIM